MSYPDATTSAGQRKRVLLTIVVDSDRGLANRIVPDLHEHGERIRAPCAAA